MSKIIVIAGGGTGGHIYPGLAIARALLKKDPSLAIHFVGSEGGLESKIVPKEGYPLHLIAGGKLNFSGRWWSKLKTLVRLPLGFIQAIGLILKLRPQFVLGVGGYASGPFVLAASLLGVPSAIWEANAHPGLANRWLARFVDRCYIVFEEAKVYLKNKKVLRFGMPVREEIEKATRAARTDHEFHIFCFGGSQGARAISQALSEALLAGGEWTEGLHVVHQIGSVDWQVMQKKYQGHEGRVTPFEFIYDMPRYYGWADLVISRGGASTIAELAAFGLPAIVIPLPLADSHQEKNAESLVRVEAGCMILQKDLSPQKLIEEITRIRKDPGLQRKMSENMRRLFQSQAAAGIADDILAWERESR